MVDSGVGSTFEVSWFVDERRKARTNKSVYVFLYVGVIFIV